MRVPVCILLLLLYPVAAQDKDRWRRVYTLDDSFIDINVSRVTFGTWRVGRVKFRTSLSKPETVPGSPANNYKTLVETIEFRCPEQQYRLFDLSYFDSKGKLIRFVEVEPPTQWKFVQPGSMMEKLFTPACELIEEKRRNP